MSSFEPCQGLISSHCVSRSSATLESRRPSAKGISSFVGMAMGSRSIPGLHPPWQDNFTAMRHGTYASLDLPNPCVSCRADFHSDWNREKQRRRTPGPPLAPQAEIQDTEALDRPGAPDPDHPAFPAAGLSSTQSSASTPGVLPQAGAGPPGPPGSIASPSRRRVLCARLSPRLRSTAPRLRHQGKHLPEERRADLPPPRPALVRQHHHLPRRRRGLVLHRGRGAAERLAEGEGLRRGIPPIAGTPPEATTIPSPEGGVPVAPGETRGNEGLH